MVCSDRNEFVGVFAVIESTVTNINPQQRHRLRFHITVAEGEGPDFRERCDRLYPNPPFGIEVKEFHPDDFLRQNICVRNSDAQYVKYMSNVMNFSRFHLGELYPTLGKVVYLDTDVIVKGDISELYDSTPVGGVEDFMFAAVPFSNFYHLGGFDQTSPLLKSLDFSKDAFNAGVYVTDLGEWNRRSILPHIRLIMLAHKEAQNPLFGFGTQPILNLIFYESFYKLAPSWNFVDLGCRPHLDRNPAFHTAKILHWSGLQKPWLREGLYQRHWRPYDRSHGDRDVLYPVDMKSETGFCYMVEIPEHSDSADNEMNRTRSMYRLYEDDVELSSPHVLHDEIRKWGSGRYSHWKTTLYFSASDNSDPTTNGKKYRLRDPRQESGEGAEKLRNERLAVVVGPT